MMQAFLESLVREGGTAESIALLPLIQRTALVLVLAQILAWHYVRFARVLSNKRKLSQVFVGLSVTTFLVITVVKTSLALSLGLVGALSIIRFRTPVKEAEELIYLFTAIAIGLGVGAEKSLATITVCFVLMLYGAVNVRFGPSNRVNRSILQVYLTADKMEGKTSADLLNILLGTLNRHVENVDLRRVDTHEGEFNASLLADTRRVNDLGALLRGVQEALPGATISVIDRELME